MNSSINIITTLSPLDWSIFFLILVVTMVFVIWGQSQKKKNQNQDESFIDLMLMGRQLTLPMFVATLVATWYGGIFGTAQIAFENGIFNFVTQGLFWYIAYIIFALFITEKIKDYEALTLPDLTGKMFGPYAQKISAILNIINLIPIAYAISIGLLIKMLFGFELYISISIGVTFVLAYSLFGGFRAVVFSDMVQFFVMCTAVISVLVFSVATYGVKPLYQLPERYFDPMGGQTFLQTLTWGLIAISTLVDPNFYQRTFAAKSYKIAKRGILISTCIWFVFDISLTFGAMYAKAIIPNAKSEYAYFTYAMQLLPNGMRGFVLAGIAATVLSTLDSYIFLSGSTLAYDLVPKRFQGKVNIHHLGILSVGIISVVLSFAFSGNIKSVWKALGSLSSSSLLVPVLLAHIYKKKFSDLHFVLSSISGAICALFWSLSGLKTLWDIDEIYVGIMASALGFYIAILLKKKKPS